MRLIKTFIFLVSFFSLSAFAQAVSYDSFYHSIEKGIYNHQHSELIKKINTAILDNPDSYSEKQIENLKALKVQILTDATLLDEGLLLSEKILRKNKADNVSKTLVHIQRALIYEILDDFEKSLIELKLAEKYIKKDQAIKKKYYAIWLQRLSSWYRMQDSKEKYYHLAVQAKKYAEATNDFYQASTASTLISFYIADRNLQEAINLTTDAIKAGKKHENTINLSYSYLNLSDYYEELNNDILVVKYADSALNIIKKTNYNNTKAAVYFEKSRLSEKYKQPDSALYYYKKHIEFKDLYDLDLRQAKIEEAGYLKIDEQNKAVKKQNQQQLYLILILLLFILSLILGASVLYSRKRKLKKQKAQIEKNNIALKKAAKEKDFYVKELNHRVKNNLAVILSLINIQDDTGNNEVLSQLHDRVNTIALGHQLYTYGNSKDENSKINLAEYVANIFQTKTYVATRKTDYQCKADAIYIDFDLALPIGLIINELITNSIKHAHPKNGKNLLLDLKIYLSSNRFQIIYTDNGTFFDVNPNTNSLGLYIIDGMINQISGSYNRTNSTYTFTIPYATSEQ